MTNESTLRHPSYPRLREDKKPQAVVLETETPVAAATRERSLVKISNRDRVIYPENNDTRANWPMIMRSSRRTCCFGPIRAPQPGPLSASAREEMLLSES